MTLSQNGKQILSFHNDRKVKSKYVNRLKQHYKQDEIIQGVYWENGKGCAVGCTVHSKSHNCYEIELGIPEWLARLEDTLFENLENGDAKKFPLKFLKAIPIGVTERQFTIVKHKFVKFLLEKQCKNTDDETVRDAINLIKSLHQRVIDGHTVTEQEWLAARSAAESASLLTTRLAAATVGPAVWSAVWSAARSAAESASLLAWSVESAARSAAKSASWLAVRLAESAESAARSAAKSASWLAAIKEQSEHLIKLLQEIIE